MPIRIKRGIDRMGRSVPFVSLKHRKEWCVLRWLLNTLKPQDRYRLNGEFDWYAMEANSGSKAREERYKQEVAYLRRYFVSLHHRARAVAMGEKPKSKADMYIAEVFAQHPDIKAAYKKPYTTPKESQ